MSDSGEVRYFRSTPERRFRPLRSLAGVAISLSVGAGAGVVYRQYESRNMHTKSESLQASATPGTLVPSVETDGIQTLYICTIQNSDGSVKTVEINIYGPESPVEVAKILAGQTGSAAGILLDGINSYNARYGADLALLVGNDLEVLNLSEGIGASALNETQKLGLKNDILGSYVHHDEGAVTTTLAP